MNSGQRPRRIAIDTGGTFTDCVYLEAGELRVLKLFSTPQDAGEAIATALGQMQAAPGAEVRHGTTVGTNTLLERTGARVAYVTTAGFEDTIGIGRQNRPHLYRWSNPAAAPLAPPELRFGADERTLADGSILRPATPAGLRRLFQQVVAARPEAVAVSLLFSFANPRNERAVARVLEELGVPVSVSHEILPEFREYERGATVLINAYLAPKMGQYLGRLQARLARQHAGARVHVMQSSGGIVSAAVAAREPVRTILSGPAGGVVGAHRLARLAGFERILSFDMGGTSTDVALVDAGGGGQLRTTHEAQVVGLPVGVPMLDIHTVGAGGGSLASFDGGGALRVGPESAGADPGPACYGRGERPTVTDANLLLGRLDPEDFLGGGLRLDEERARRVFARSKGTLATVEAFADGIVRLAEATMEKALRMISVERGFDPREFTLVSFGGAGPLHACALAEGLAIPRVLVPRMPGALSALGILMSDMVKDYSRTVMETVAAGAAAKVKPRLETQFRALEARGAREMRAEGLRASAVRSLDLRYAGQGYELNLDWHGRGDFAGRFHALHQRRYGYADATRALEVVNLRVRMVAASPEVKMPRQRPRRGDGRQALARRRRVWFAGAPRQAAVYARERLRAGDRFAGPALVTEYSATTVVPPGWGAQVDGWQNLVLERKGAAPK